MGYQDSDASSFIANSDIGDRLTSFCSPILFNCAHKFIKHKECNINPSEVEIVDNYDKLFEEDPYKISYLLNSDLPLDDEDVIQQIEIASEERNYKLVRQLIHKYPGIFSRNANIETFRIFENAIKSKNVWLVNTIINDKIDMLLLNETQNNAVNVLFSNFCIRKLKSCSIARTLIESVKHDLNKLYELCNNFNEKGMTALHDSVRVGDIDAIEYMKMINKTNKFNIFDFSLCTQSTNESIFHIASKNDHYYLIDTLANTNADIFARDKYLCSSRQVSCHTLIVLTTLRKIESNRLINKILHRRVAFIQKYTK